MGNLEATLISARASRQGEASLKGKFTKDYQDASAAAFMAKKEIEKLGVTEGANVKLTSKAGYVVVSIHEDDRVPEAHVVMRVGPWLNMLTPTDLGQVGLPTYTGTKVKVEKTSEPVKALISLF